MSEPLESVADASVPGALPAAEERSAGQMLRQARQAQGLHVAALAAAIKITPQKLEALENGRLEELPDPTFARALSLAVCRYLKIDPAPILARLPQPREHRLEHIHRGLATTFRERPGRASETGDAPRLLKPALLGPLFVLVAALLVYMVPVHMWHLPFIGTEAEAPATGAAGTSSSEGVVLGAAALQAPMVEPAPAPATATAAGADGTSMSSAAASPATTPSTSQAPGANTGIDAGTGISSQSAAAVLPAASAPATASPPLSITATKESWVEVVDADNRVLLSRSIPAGETVDLDGPAPLKLRIGNAIDTQVVYRGQAVPLAPVTRDNIARLELK